jgi:hypothetical protein
MAIKGSIPWNKGLHGAELQKHYSKLPHRFKKGHIPWNKNLTKLTDSRVRKYSEYFKGKNNPMYGKSPSKKTKKLLSKHALKMWKNPEHRKLISLLESGEKNPFYHKHHKNKTRHIMIKHHWTKRGFEHPMLNKHLSDNHKKNISLGRRGKYTGESNHMWRDGISFEPYGLEFNEHLKEQIRQRDGRSCQYCGLKENGHKLPVHHIDYNKKNNDSENLITLCVKCHSATLINRELWTNYFSSFIRAVYASALPVTPETALTVADFYYRTASAFGSSPSMRVSS